MIRINIKIETSIIQQLLLSFVAFVAKRIDNHRVFNNALKILILVVTRPECGELFAHFIFAGILTRVEEN